MFRGLLGVGVGLIVPLSTGLIIDFFKDDEQNKMMGYAIAVNNLGAVIAIVLAGLLASISWRLSFGVYSIALFVLLLVIFYLPEQEVEVQKPKEIKDSNTTSINKYILYLMLLITIVNVVFYSVPTNISILIRTLKLGDASISGIIISTLNLTSFLTGVFFHKISNILKKYTLTFSLIVMFIGFLTLTISRSILQIVFSLVFIGTGLGIILPFIFISTGKYASCKNSTFSIALVSSSMYFGQFLSPLLISISSKFFGNTSIKFPFLFSTILIGITLLIPLFQVLKKED